MSFLKGVQQWLRHRPAFHKALRSIVSPPERIFRHLYFDGEFTVEVESGVTFELVAFGSQVENELFWREFGDGWEGNSLRVWREMLRHADYVADIGANTGVYALAAQALRPQAKIIALEPSTRVFERLARNIALNQFAITALECAASDRTGTAVFHELPGIHQYSSSLERPEQESVETEVRVARFDDVLASAGFERLDALKLDVEMHEPAVLRGMRGTLELHRPAILVEVLDERQLGEIKLALEGMDYAVRKVADGKHEIERNYVFANPEMVVAIERALPGLLIG